MSGSRWPRLLALAAVLGSLCACQPGASPAPASVETAIATPWRGKRVDPYPPWWEERGDWVGDDLCAVCHPDAFDSFTDAAHAALLRDELGWGCESCHGPGATHEELDSEEGVDRFGTLDPDQVAVVCARCHFEELRQLDQRGRHLGVERYACTDCHQAHHPKVEGGVSRWAREQDARCADCHADAIAVHRGSRHAALMEGPDAVGCQGCHGPAHEHLESGGAPGTMAKLERRDQELLCAQCHREERQLARWNASSHRHAGVGCLDCHELVEPASADPHADETALCARCHESAVAEFRLPNRHPVLEGDMSCTDCHDVHGDRPGVLANRRLQQRCEECHAGTVGPFVHEHEAGRIDGCAACHQPHGSPNRLLLTMTPVRDLCLSCHPSTPATHTLAGFSPFLECAQCHTEVHGSDLSPRLFR